MKAQKDSLGKRLWALFVAGLATLAAIETPIRLLYGYSGEGSLFWSDGLITLTFALDFLFHCYEAGWIYVPGCPGLKQEGYYGRGWLISDLLAAIPFTFLPGPNALELFRLLKLARVGQVIRQWRQAVVHYASVLRIAASLFWLGLLTHWISCGWLALRGFAPEYDAATNYLRALYWAVTTLATVGYGDITPTNNPQMIYAIGTMLIGAAAYGFMIANVASILANIDPAKVRYREIVERLTAFMRYRNIPPLLQQRILDYNAYLWEKRLGYDESSAIAGLPPSLRAEVSLFLNREIIERVPMFRGANPDFIRAVALEMRPVIFTPGDYIVRAGETGREMFFISRGAIEILSPDERQVYATLTAGDFFGEMALLLDQPRVATARAVEYCDLYVLEKATFDHILSRFGDFGEHLRKVAVGRQKVAANGTQPVPVA